ncbi:hypothetical protein ATN84_03595 [Paramesorhizobium deserti]|uniref:DUF2934 domain-containing protein n=1 Tax=Paramesorhizobium deserti TaxID=1494590 RepID=A0A135I082_9HYPH|nr:DUF2934 domain-containing protein [Paramesorhizobium deserti]KXF78857.1 hypothetical protein ATN84_03595 [Paramesorhizobium deserti]
MANATAREEWIKRRARKLWEREGLRPDQEQECWDKAVQEFEAASSEENRGPAHPDPAVGSTSDPTKLKHP